jgi:hypothetical protein
MMRKGSWSADYCSKAERLNGDSAFALRSGTFRCSILQVVKNVLCFAIGVCALICFTALADNPAKSAKPPAPSARWSVRAEVLMVDMPQAKALALLPDLRDSRKIWPAPQKLIQVL